MQPGALHTQPAHEILVPLAREVEDQQRAEEQDVEPGPLPPPALNSAFGKGTQGVFRCIDQPARPFHRADVLRETNPDAVTVAHLAIGMPDREAVSRSTDLVIGKIRTPRLSMGESVPASPAMEAYVDGLREILVGLRISEIRCCGVLPSRGAFFDCMAAHAGVQ